MLSAENYVRFYRVSEEIRIFISEREIEKSLIEVDFSQDGRVLATRSHHRGGMCSVKAFFTPIPEVMLPEFVDIRNGKSANLPPSHCRTMDDMLRSVASYFAVRARIGEKSQSTVAVVEFNGSLTLPRVCFDMPLQQEGNQEQI